ncbi:hypothetical protein C2869_12820 [Saccharobesus litoralis]|uniref:Uncharacterized protein n=2 Tax=Saccharobesus litoralis TaxID=2172099 RepID=A0A2S0VSS6_9ALTE|nr:hypothetical protein C2869_12820 [Saccharobesus litoralis]
MDYHQHVASEFAYRGYGYPKANSTNQSIPLNTPANVAVPVDERQVVVVESPSIINPLPSQYNPQTPSLVASKIQFQLPFFAERIYYELQSRSSPQVMRHLRILNLSYQGPSREIQGIRDKLHGLLVEQVRKSGEFLQMTARDSANNNRFQLSGHIELVNLQLEVVVKITDTTSDKAIAEYVLSVPYV